jgi:hypothetical protein
MAETELEFAFAMAKDMLDAGVEQLKQYDPEKDDAHTAVARIYFAMELVREALEQGTWVEMPNLDKSQLN